MWDGPAPPPAETRFIGRRREVGAVTAALKRFRLVTVTGVGGVGKTRVALRVAAGARRTFPDGVRVVELSGVTDPGQVEQAVAHAFAGVGPGGTAAALAARVADLRALLILDTCEHLVEPVALLVQTLLAAGSRLRVLATSRQPLGIPGERIVPVPPMRVPDPDRPADPAALAGCESVALFVDRVAAAVPGFRLTRENAAAIAELCARLDGIPLAIELAAARVPALGVARLAATLKDRLSLGGSGASRHHSVGAAIRWSHDLCTAEERTAWARLSVFHGPFDLPAVEAVCVDGAFPAARVYPAVAGLVDKSILTACRCEDGMSYRMLDTIREYGLARLAASGEHRRLLRRHRDHFFALVVAAGRVGAAAAPAGSDRAGPGTAGSDGVAGTPGQRGGLLRRWREVRRCWPDIRAALDRCAADPAEAGAGLALAARAWFLWTACGMARQGRHELERFLALVPPPDPERPWALLVLAYVAMAQGDHPAAHAALDRCAAELPAPGDPRPHACLRKLRGTLACLEGRFADAERLLGEVTTRLRDHLLPEVRTAALAELGLNRMWRGDVEGARATLTECRELCERIGDAWVASYADYGLGLVARADGDAAAATTLLRAALRVKRVPPDVLGMLQCLEVLAWLAAEQADFPRAARLLHAVRRHLRERDLALLGSPLFTAEHARCERAIRRALTARERELARREGAAMSLDEIVDYALGEEEPSPPGPEDDAWAPLTPRERDVAALLAAGLTNREIADRLLVTARTVETHVGNILAKLGFATRAQIAAWSARRRLGDA